MIKIIGFLWTFCCFEPGYTWRTWTVSLRNNPRHLLSCLEMFSLWYRLSISSSALSLSSFAFGYFHYSQLPGSSAAHLNESRSARLFRRSATHSILTAESSSYLVWYRRCSMKRFVFLCLCIWWAEPLSFRLPTNKRQLFCSSFCFRSQRCQW